MTACRLHIRCATIGLTAGLLAWAQAAAAAPPAGHDCLIEPGQTVELRSAVAGVIEKVHVTRGQSVKKGALLVSLSSEVERTAVALAQYKSGLQGAVQAAEGRLAHAERKVQRRGDLAALNYASAQESEDAQVERALAAADLVNAREAREVARLEYANALAQLAQRSLSSPIDGVVVDQALYAGELADPRDNKPYILKLAQIHPLRVRLILPVALYPRVRTGQRAEVTPEAPHEVRGAATVVSVDKVIDAASGTFQVRLELPNPAGTLPAGLKCRATLPGL